MKHITSKLLSLLLCLAMLMSMVPAAYADVETEGASGKNTPTETNGGASEQDDAYDDAPDTAVVQSTAAATTDAAKVGETGYTTLDDAIKAAKDGDTVTLLADRTEDVTITTSITLDLNSKTLTNTNAGKATISVTGGTVTVKNGTVIGGASYYNIEVTKNSNAGLILENVTATAGNTGSSMIDNWGTLTINSGSYTGGMNTVKSEEGSTLVINNGTFTCDYGKKWSYTATILVYGDTTINGGTFIQETTNTSSYAKVVMTGIVEGYEAITRVTDGTFTNEKLSGIFYAYGKATSDNFEVSGGTFNKSISDGYCADGFIPTKNADGTYGVKEGKYVAAVGSKKYETLADAIRLAAKGKTVKLLDDVTENIEIAKAKNFTLDLNGHTINGGTVKDKATITNYGTVTITDKSTAKTGTIKRDDQGVEGETSYYVIRNIGTMTIEQANVVNNSGYRKTNPSGSMVGSSLICNGGDVGATLTINGGTFTQMNFLVVKNDALGTLNVTGGTFTSKHSAIQNWFKANITGGEINGQLWTDSWAVGESVGETTIGGNATVKGEIVMDITGSVKPTLEISGGNFDVTWRITNAAAKAGAKPAVSGGTFSSAVKPEYCAPGFVPKANSDGTYGVTRHSSGSSSYDPTYSVSTPSKTENGSVTVSPKSASKGDTVTVTVKPDSGYVLETLTVTDKNGNELTLKDKGNGKYTFTMPAGKVEVKATFMEDNSVLNFFYDVPNDAFFYEAVKWAVKSGVTNGLSDTMFGPYESCTRAQIVTFLWRAAGSPEPKTASSFTDVSASAYYAKAVAWAVENGITNGMTETTFAPDATRTRGQSVTFLHRALKGTASGSANFTDVKPDAFYADAVSWAVKNDVTNGTSNTTFSPNADCTRAEIVTFLYRAYQGK